MWKGSWRKVEPLGRGSLGRSESLRLSRPRSQGPYFPNVGSEAPAHAAAVAAPSASQLLFQRRHVRRWGERFLLPLPRGLHGPILPARDQRVRLPPVPERRRVRRRPGHLPLHLPLGLHREKLRGNPAPSHSARSLGVAECRACFWTSGVSPRYTRVTSS